MRKISAIVVLLLICLPAVSTFLTASHIASAQEEPIKLLWDDAHDQYYSSSKFQTLFSSLRDQEVEVEGSTANLTLSLLQNYSILVIANPRAELSSEEITAVSEFVKGGRALIILGDIQYDDRHYGQPDNLNAILEKLGVADQIRFWGTNDNGDEIYDDVHYAGATFQPTVTKEYFKPHIISVGIEEVVINSASLIVTNPDIIVATSDSDAYAMDTQGNRHASGYVPWLAALNVDKGKVIVCGSSKMFSDLAIYNVGTSFISYKDNMKLFFNFIWWLTGKQLKPPAQITMFIPIVDIFGIVAGIFAQYNFKGNVTRLEKYAVIVALIYAIIAVIQAFMLNTIVFGLILPNWGRVTAGIASENLPFDLPLWFVAGARYFLAGIFEVAAGAILFAAIMWLDREFDLGLAKKIGYIRK